MAQRRTYSREFKVQALEMIVDQGLSVAEVSRELGVHQNVLRKWKLKLAEDGEAGFRGNGKLSPEQEELRRLREENRQLRMERDILKKATAFFAKESR